MRSRVQGMKKEFVDKKQRQTSKNLERVWVNVMKIMYCRRENSTMKNRRKNGYNNYTNRKMEDTLDVNVLEDVSI